MEQERWQRIKELFQEALGRPSGERILFLERICDGDPELFGEVRSLLAAHDSAGSFLESPAMGSVQPHARTHAAEEVDGAEEVSGAALSPGSSLGHLEILAPLGAGGMGEVYRARDTRLDRQVAVKVIKGRAAGDQARARFEREAKAIAALSHPNILAIHDFGQVDGRAYAVTELLEGETLRERLESETIGPRKAIGFALQIAQGLAAAHDRGIVHRDLKPDNIFITRDGLVKILDFGLARLVGSDGVPPGASRSGRPQTQPGAVLGTPAYMSPEQVRGEAVDHLTDIFSFGAVFFEMLTGARPFGGETPVEALHAVLKDEPADLASTGRGMPPGLDRVVRRCLEKRPEERFQSARDLAFAIEAVSDESSRWVTPAPGPVERPSRRRWVPLALIALGAVAGGLVAGRLLWKPGPVAPVGAPTLRTLTYSGRDSAPAASPDGRLIAFTSDRDGRRRIWLKQVAGGSERALTSGSDDLARISPDGSTVLFTRAHGGATALYRVPLLGGEPRKVVDDATDGDWSPDGRNIVFIRWKGRAGQARPRVLVARVDGSGERELARLGNRVRVRPRWSPDGKMIAVTGLVQQPGVPQSIVLVPAAGGKPRKLTAAGGVGYVSAVAWRGPEEIIYSQAESVAGNNAGSPAHVFRQRIGDGRAQILLWSPSSSLVLDILGPRRLVMDARSPRQNLRDLPLGPRRRGSRPRWLTRGLSTDRQPVFSPDGKWVVFSSNRSGNLDVWAVSTRSGAVRRLTDHPADDWDPAYTPDAKRLLWSSKRSGHFEVWIADADGSGARQVTRDGVDAENPTASRDGRWIVYASGNPKSPGVWKIHPDGTGAARLVPGAILPEVSPDGTLALYQFNRGPRLAAVKVVRIADGQVLPFEIRIEVRKPTTALLGRARWMPDGKRIAFVGQDAHGVNGIFVQAFEPGKDTRATRRPLGGFAPDLVAESFAVSPDGKRLVVAGWEQNFAVLMATGVVGVGAPRSSGPR